MCDETSGFLLWAELFLLPLLDQKRTILSLLVMGDRWCWPLGDVIHFLLETNTGTYGELVELFIGIRIGNNNLIRLKEGRLNGIV